MNNKKSMLITGGTGSFGKQFIKYLLSLPKNKVPGKIFIYSRDEDKQFHQRQEFNDPRLHYIIGDVRDLNAMVEATRGISYIVHAAALKHVSNGEIYPDEVIKTNVVGCQNVIYASKVNNVERVVVISTDKAVEPINAYGMSKAIAEKLVSATCANLNNKTVFTTVRYGNVAGSRGSVIPLFISKIQNDEVLTVTDPEMTRFHLKLEEAVGLVHHALLYGKSGDMFVKGSPASTVQVLIDTLELHFKKKINFKVIGARPGEKYHEKLLASDEVFRCKKVKSREGGEILRVPSLLAKESQNIDTTKLKKSPDLTSATTKQLSKEELMTFLKSINLL